VKSLKSLKSRIERIEQRVAMEKPVLSLVDACHYLKLSNPEWFQREAADPACRDWAMLEALNAPIPKKVKRLFHNVLLGLVKFPPAPPPPRWK
jgi:hypothetical protein